MSKLIPPQIHLALIFALILLAAFGKLFFFSLPSPTRAPLTLTLTLTPTPTPTPAPLTFAQLNSLYGPCTYTPTLTYHHIQTSAAAKADKQTSLTVYTDIFTKQMQYLADRGYTPVTLSQISNFFDTGSPLPSKSVLLTFDDGYVDFFTDAAPVLRAHNFPAVMYLPTGLVNNPDYLTWDQISQLTGLVTFANHTWSHHSLNASPDIISKEILTADTQLSEHSLNSPKTFAYPYGTVTSAATALLSQHGYSLAFTTRYGSVLCAKQRLTLPRLHIGNTSLSAYGL